MFGLNSNTVHFTIAGIVVWAEIYKDAEEDGGYFNSGGEGSRKDGLETMQMEPEAKRECSLDLQSEAKDSRRRGTCHKMGRAQSLTAEIERVQLQKNS